MNRKYVEILFNHINRLRKYRWLHIAVFIEYCILIYDTCMLTILYPHINDLKIQVALFLLTYIFSSFFAVSIIVFLLIIFLLLKYLFKNINKTKSKFLLYSPIYTPFFFFGLLCMLFFFFGFVLYLKINQWL